MKSIKNKVLLIFVMIIVIIFGIFRIRMLNLQYPNPQEIYFHINEDCTISDYLIRLLDIELLSGEEIQDFSFGMPFLYNIDGTPYPWEKQRMILTTIELEGTNDQNTLIEIATNNFDAKLLEGCHIKLKKPVTTVTDENWKYL